MYKRQHQKEINQIDLKQCQKLMIVAHPDDEKIWGGSHLLKGHYLVAVSYTHLDVYKRQSLVKFQVSCFQLHDIPLSYHT